MEVATQNDRLTYRALKDGKRFIFSNEIFQKAIGGDDIRQVEVFHSKHLNKLVIYFNGKIIHSSRTFPGMFTRLQELDKTWHLYPVHSEDEQ